LVGGTLIKFLERKKKYARPFNALSCRPKTFDTLNALVENLQQKDISNAKQKKMIGLWLPK
jgi:hypothetical protein